MKDDLILKINGKEYSGWTEIKVTRGIERCPSDFDISLTERMTKKGQAFLIKPGDACQIYLGKDLVITGYIDINSSYVISLNCFYWLNKVNFFIDMAL